MHTTICGTKAIPKSLRNTWALTLETTSVEFSICWKILQTSIAFYT